MLIFKEKALRERELCRAPGRNVHPSPLKENARLGARQQSNQDEKKNNKPGHTVQNRQKTRVRGPFLSLEKGNIFLKGCLLFMVLQSMYQI